MVLSSRDRWLLTGLAMFALVLVAWRYLHLPLKDKLIAVHADLDHAQTDVRKAQGALKQEGDQTQRRAHVEQLQQQLASLIPGRESARYFVYYLDKAQSSSGARIHRLAMDTPVKSGDLLDIPVKLEISGLFASHVMFDQALEHMPVFTATHRFALKGNDSPLLPTVGKGLLVNWGNVDGEYTIHLYFQPTTGPETPLRFDSAAGRPDPFIYAGVSEFMQDLQDAFPNGGGSALPPQLG